MSEKQSPYEMACAFHEVFNPQQPEQPTAFSPELASRRAEFKVEELVEFYIVLLIMTKCFFNNWSTD